MYESHFRFQQRPFLAAPRADRYFATATAEAARATLARCIERAEGPAILIGPPGTGKSLLLLLLAEQFRDEFEAALLSSTRLNTPRALLQAVLYELGQPFRGLDEGELRLNLVDHLANHENQRQGLLLLVDEAHLLPLRVLLEIRVLTNLVRRGAPQVRLVLAGAAALEERFAHPRLDSFNQRLAARCYLSAMDRSETEQFVLRQVEQVGGSSRLFQPDALGRVFSATDGVPRLVNQLCDHALLSAFADGRTEIDAGVVDQAWADLQQLPAPWNQRTRQDAAGEGRADIIEIGALDEDDEQPSVFEIGAERTSSTDRRLDAINVHLAALDDDYQPELGTQTEIEFTPKSPAELFNEPFDEEEVVLDRYSQWDAVRAAAGRVASKGDDASLAALLRAVERREPRPMAAAACAVTPNAVAEGSAPSWTAPPIVNATTSESANRVEAQPTPKPPRRPQKYGSLFSKLRSP